MGKGKGNVECWVALVQPGKVLYEMSELVKKLQEKHLDLWSKITCQNRI